MQHHSPASVAATAGVSVALRIYPKKVGHPCHSNIRQITTFILVHELASSLHQFSFHSPYCSSYASCATKTPWWFERKDQVDKSFPVGRSVLLLLLQNLPFLYPWSVNRKWLFFYVLHMSNDFTWTKTLQTGLCHHAPCHYHLPTHISPTRTLQTTQELETPQLQAPHLPSNQQAGTSRCSTRFQLQDVNRHHPVSKLRSIILGSAAGGVALLLNINYVINHSYRIYFIPLITVATFGLFLLRQILVLRWWRGEMLLNISMESQPSN